MATTEGLETSCDMNWGNLKTLWNLALKILCPLPENMFPQCCPGAESPRIFQTISCVTLDKYSDNFVVFHAGSVTSWFCHFQYCVKFFQSINPITIRGVS